MDDRIGQVLQGTYRLERLIGKGGMGAVYEASHLRLTRRFAVKLLSATLAENAEAFNRFRREARITGSLGHPHIVQVFDFDKTDEGVPFIVMELLRGEDLASRLGRVGRLELDAAGAILQQAGSALQAAHERMIVHRDLKPHNIMLCDTGDPIAFVKVLDFGVSKVINAVTQLTRTHAALGTPIYMSPEQAEERSAEVDRRADIYAMGTILFEMLTGKTPFAARSVPALLYKIVHREPAALRDLRPDLPAPVEDVIRRAMHKDPSARFDSMQDFWQAYAACLERAGIPVPGRRIRWKSVQSLADVAAPTTLSVERVAPQRPSALWPRAALLLAALVALVGLGAGIALSVVRAGDQTTTAGPAPRPRVVAAVADARSSPVSVAAADQSAPPVRPRDLGASSATEPASTPARRRVHARAPTARRIRRKAPRPRPRPRRQTVELRVVTLLDGKVIEGAKVYLDGRLLGETALLRTVDIEPGTHTIVARKGGLVARQTRTLRGADARFVLHLRRR